ncbi:repressor of the inhibitor of the protein kinase [Nymphon striatum]|nr:repressor of the inhibitor of the protein kinase [Nymphon striatum]
MLDTLKQLGLFFKYSPKRSRRLEEAISEYNSKVPKTDQISKSKFHVFSIGQTSPGWDTKAITDAYGLLNRITDSHFIMCFQTISFMFGYVTGLSNKLQGSTLVIIEAYEMVNIVKNAVSAARNKDAEMIFQRSSTMARKAGLDCFQMPRRCDRQTQRNNVPANNTEEYFVRAILNPFVDSLIQQLDMRFNSMTRQACLALCLLPNNMEKLTEDAVISIVEHYQDDMPQPETFQQELRLWKLTWRNKSKKPATITETLSETCNLMYPNIFKILTLVQLTSVTSANVERSNSSLRFIKNAHRSTMGQVRFNALMLLFMHRDIKLDFGQIINDYARNYPRRKNRQNDKELRPPPPKPKSWIRPYAMVDTVKCTEVAAEAAISAALKYAPDRIGGGGRSFVYVLDMRREERLYWKCEKRKECSGRLITEDDELRSEDSHHTHVPDPAHLAVLRAVYVIQHRAANSEEPTSSFKATWIGVMHRGRRRRPLFHHTLWKVHGRVVDELPRTNNSLEGWHNSFDRRVVTTHPTIRRLVAKLLKEQAYNEILLEQFSARIQVARSCKKYKLKP